VLNAKVHPYSSDGIVSSTLLPPVLEDNNYFPMIGTSKGQYSLL